MLVPLFLATFLAALDVTIVNLALPSISSDLRGTTPGTIWVISAYTLPVAVLILSTGRLGDIVGLRVPFVVGMTVFLAGSVACAAAATLSWLIAARVVQGVGAAVLLPQSMTAIVRILPAARRGIALGMLGSITGVAGVLALTLGGFLVAVVGWRAIFWINVPFAGVALLFTAAIPGRLPGRNPTEIDVLGTVIATAAIAALVFCLSEGANHSSAISGPLPIAILAAVSIALFGTLAIHQRSRQSYSPLVPFDVLRAPGFRPMSAVALLISVALIGFTLQATLYLQQILRLNAFSAGLVLLPISGLSLVCAPVAGRLSAGAGAQWVLRAGLGVFLLGVTLLFMMTGGIRLWSLLVVFAVTGVGIGVVYAPNNTLAVRAVPATIAGGASGLLNAARQLGLVLGAAIAALVTSLVGTGVSEDAAAVEVVLVVPAAALTLALAITFTAGRERRGSGADGRVP
jgi:EmrB/QacA subfamily drug resistance transporter